MNMVPSIVLDKELRVSDFKLSSEYFKNFSFLFYGFELKSEYDEKRYRIHKSLKPKKFAHLVNPISQQGLVPQSLSFEK